jgi:hypothetical protein
MQINEAGTVISEKLIRLITDAHAAREAYEVYKAEKWAHCRDKERTRIARLSLIDMIDCMYETYLVRDYRCPEELAMLVCATKRQMDITEESLEAEEVFGAENKLYDIFDAMDATLCILAEQLDLKIDPPIMEEDDRPMTTVDYLLNLCGSGSK